jgi:hypothetical protein
MSGAMSGFDRGWAFNKTRMALRLCGLRVRSRVLFGPPGPATRMTRDEVMALAVKAAGINRALAAATRDTNLQHQSMSSGPGLLQTTAQIHVKVVASLDGDRRVLEGLRNGGPECEEGRGRTLRHLIFA